MTLKEYASIINELLKYHPNDLLVYAVNDEGNIYREVLFGPCLVNYNPKDRTIVDDADLSGTGEEFNNHTLIKAVCIN